MDEPATTAAGGLLAKGLASIGFGAVGALIMAAFDPPKTRRALFWQALASAAGSLVFGHAALRVLDHFTPWVDIAALPQDQWIEWAAPVYFVVGALSWGLFGALAQLRRALRERGVQHLEDLLDALISARRAERKERSRD